MLVSSDSETHRFIKVKNINVSDDSTARIAHSLPKTSLYDLETIKVLCHIIWVLDKAQVTISPQGLLFSVLFCNVAAPYPVHQLPDHGLLHLEEIYVFKYFICPRKHTFTRNVTKRMRILIIHPDTSLLSLEDLILSDLSSQKIYPSHSPTDIINLAGIYRDWYAFKLVVTEETQTLRSPQLGSELVSP